MRDSEKKMKLTKVALRLEEELGETHVVLDDPPRIIFSMLWFNENPVLEASWTPSRHRLELSIEPASYQHGIYVFHEFGAPTRRFHTALEASNYAFVKRIEIALTRDAAVFILHQMDEGCSIQQAVVNLSYVRSISLSESEMRFLRVPSEVRTRIRSNRIGI